MSLLRRLFNALRRSRRDDDLREELETHLALIEEEERSRGLTDEEARLSARARFGNPLSYRERALDAVTVQWLEDAWKDLRFAVRQLRKAPGFTAVAIVSLALGVGANAAIFTLINAVLFKSLPVRDPGGLFLLGNAHGRGVAIGQVGRPFVLYSYDLYKHLRDADALDGLCAFQSAEDRAAVRRGGSSAAEPASTRLVSGNYFQLLGVNASVGRTIVPADDVPSAAPVAVVSFRYWRNALNEDRSAVGRTIDLGGTPVVIVGVAPPEFFGETIEPDPPSFWLPIAAARELQRGANLIDEPDRHWLYVMGRLKPNVTAAQAEARLTLTLQNWLLARARADRDDRAGIAKSRVDLTPMGGGVPHVQRSYTRSLQLLLGISMAVLLIACANIAGLLLARGMARRTERLVRLALGATRGRLLRQSLTESLTLALAGGALALVVAPVAARLLVAMVFGGADDVPIQTMPDARVLAFTFALSCAAALVFGLAPALRMQTDIAPAIRSGRFRFGKALIVGEVAVSLAVLAGGGSLATSLANLAGQSFGFDRTHLLIVGVEPTLAHYQLSRLAPLYQQLISRLNSLPGVKSASFSYYSPFNGCCWAFTVDVPGYTPREDESMSALLNRVAPRYFETLGTRLLGGRAFSDDDTPTSRRVVVVNETLVRRFFHDADPIGRPIHIGSEGRDVDLEIIGVVDDAKYEDPRDEMRPMVFLPLLQMKRGEPEASGDYQSNFIRAIEVRTAADPARIAALVRQTLSDIDPDLPVLRVETLSDHIDESLRQERIVATLAALFGVLALVLTCIGLYGLMAYLVQRRTNEIGLRIALGARRAAVMGMVIREALEQAIAGVLAGIPIAFAATRLMANQLYGVSATDPRNAVAAAVVLVASLGLAACLVARRASRIDPIRALRQD